MLNLSVIILTYNEEIHIQRCIESVIDIASNIYVVDSYSNDRTVEIANKYNASVYYNKWENNHSKQFNWALNNLPIDSEWILRLDADEYLLPDLTNEIKIRLNSLDRNINGIIFKRRHIFLSKWIKNGTYPVKLLRLFRYKKAICEQRWMDEHIVLLEGEIIEFENDFVDHNLNNLSWWIQKHNGYSIKEAIDLLDIEFNFTDVSQSKGRLNQQANVKRELKKRYTNQPLFLRAFLFFIYRYILKL